MKIPARSMAALAVLAVIAAILILILQSPPADRYVLRKAREYLRTRQGIELQAERFRYSLFNLSAAMEGVSLRSSSDRSGIPFLKVRSLQVRLSPLGLLRGIIALREVRLEGVEAHVVVSEGGTSNLPEVPEQETAPDSSILPRFLLISRLQAGGGSFLLEDHHRQIQVRFPLWSLQVEGHPVTLKHRMLFQTAASGTVVVRGQSIPIGRLTAATVIATTEIAIENLRADIGGSHISLSGTLDNRAPPELDVDVSAELDTAEAARFSRLGVRTAGRLQAKISVKGPVDRIAASAQLRGEGLSIEDYQHLRLTAAAEWDSPRQRVQVTSLDLRSPAGSLTAQADLALAATAGPSRLQARGGNLDLRQLSRRLDLPLQVDSRASAEIEAEWEGTDFRSGRADGQVRLVASRSVPEPKILPVSGALSVAARRGKIRVEVTSVRALGMQLQGALTLDLPAARQADLLAATLGGELHGSAGSVSKLAADLDAFLGAGWKLPQAAAEERGQLELLARLEGTLQRPVVSGSVEGNGLGFGNFQDLDLNLRAEYAPERVLLEEAKLAWQGQALQVRGMIGLQGASPPLSLNAVLTDGSIGAIAAGLGRRAPVEGNFNVEANIGGTLRNLNGVISASATDLSAYGESAESLELQARLQDQNIELTKLELKKAGPDGSPGYLSVTGGYDLASRTYRVEGIGRDLQLTGLTLPVGGKLDSAEPGASATGQKVPPALPVRGKLNLQASGEGTLQDPLVQAKADLDGLQVGDRALGEVSVVASLEGRQAMAEVAVPRLELAGKIGLQTQPPYPATFEVTATDTDLSLLSPLLPVAALQKETLQGHVAGALSGSGPLQDWKRGRAELKIDRLLVSTRGHELRAEPPLELRYEDGVFHAVSAVLALGDSSLRIGGSLPVEEASAAGPSLQVQGEMDVAALAAFLSAEPGISAGGTLKIDAVIAGSLRRPDPSGVVTLEDGLLEHPLLALPVTAAALELSYQDQAMELRRASARLGAATLAATGSLPVSVLFPEQARAGAQERAGAALTLEIQGLQLSSFRNVPPRADGTVTLQLQAGAPRLDDWNALRASVTFQQLELRIGEYGMQQAGPSAITLEKGIARIDRLELTGPGTRIQAGGTAELAARQRLDVRLNGNLDAAVLTLFTGGFRARGDSRIELAVAGTLPAPQFSGTVELHQGQAGLSSPRIEAESLDVLLRLGPDRVSIEQFTGRVNGGPLQASGWVDYAGTRLENFHLDVSVDGAFLDFPEGLRSRLQANLQVRSQDEFIQLGGAVGIFEGAFREPVQLEGELLEYFTTPRAVTGPEEPHPFLSRLRYNLAVNTDGPVVIDNNLARAALDGNLRLRGSYDRPALTGRITLEEGGLLYLREKTYQVERGVISLYNPVKIEPDLDIVARTRASRYDITLTLAGPPENFSATFTSDPPLPQPDIISILMTGRTLSEIRGSELNVAGEQALSYLSGGVAGRLSRGAEQALGLSQVRIEPNLIAPESNPGARLTLGEDLTPLLRLIYSVNLTDSQDQIYIVEYDLTDRFATRGVKQNDNSYRFEFHHGLQFGGVPEGAAGARAPRREQVIGTIVFEGETLLQERDLARAFGLERGERYDFFRLQKAVDRLASRYHKQGRLEARIRAGREDKGDVVDLTLHVDAGPKLSFIFEGTSPNGKIRKQVETIWIEGIFDASRAEDCRQAIRASLVEKGYMQSDVDSRIENPSPEEKRVVFTITPGSRFSNVRLRLEGATVITVSELQEMLEEEDLTTELHTEPAKIQNRLLAFYRRQGYLAASVGHPRADLDPASGTGAVVIQVEEGPLFRIGDVEFHGNRAFSKSRLQEAAALVAGQSYHPELLRASQSGVQDVYWSAGYNDVVIDYEQRPRREAGLVDVTFHVTENRKQVVQEIRVEGNKETSARFVREQMEISEGDALDFKKSGTTRRNLYQTGAYSMVDIDTQPLERPAGAPADSQPVALQVKLRELKPFDLRYGAFYDTERGPGFIADFANRNSLGSARVVGMRARYDSDLHELRAYFSQPMLRGRALKSNATGFVRRELFESFITDRTGFSLQQEARFADSLVFSYGYRFERVDTFDRDPESLFKIPPLHIAPITATLVRDIRDDILEATRGSFSSHALEYGPAFLGSDLRFIKYFGQYSRYVPLSDPVSIPFSGGKERSRVVYAGNVRVGLAGGLGGQELIRSERFFAGGGTTLRGFEQDSVGPRDFLGDPAGGDAVFITNHEIRFPLIGMFDGVTFLDLGNVYARAADFNPFKVRKSAGLGLRVHTPYFLLRFDYGFKLDRRPGETAGGFFLNIGQAF
ncbi:MAG: translocation/assembly module TamB domain-containing protein [Acidobacteria bacterium]|nr:translocation/assembly module TamB domain-containing protein [Acidobacteriota bacterium]